jgi:hypothetical protein
MEIYGNRAVSMIEAQDVGIHSLFFNQMLLGESKVYEVAESFGTQLSRANLRIDTKFLPDVGWSCLLEFPKGLCFEHNGVWHKSAIIAMGSLRDEVAERSIQILCPDYATHDGWEFSEGSPHSVAVMPLVEGKTLEDCLALLSKQSGTFSILTPDQDFGVSPISIECMAFCLKCVLYIHSAKPDLVIEFKPCLTKNHKKVRRHYSENAPFPVVKVGFGFHGKTWHVDQTTVTGHFRWQPCGIGLSRVKLIWIDEHSRFFKTEAIHKGNGLNEDL